MKRGLNLIHGLLSHGVSVSEPLHICFFLPGFFCGVAIDLTNPQESTESISRAKSSSWNQGMLKTRKGREPEKYSGSGHVQEKGTDAQMSVVIVPIR